MSDQAAFPAPGLLVLHGNRLEDLAQTLLAWLARHPLRPLEEETVLVQSNGMAEWVKMAFAQTLGVCAATRVELPARFIWRAYRAVLGRDEVPAGSALDKLPMTWRLMSLLPRLQGNDMAPLQAFMKDGSASRRFQLAQRIADLFDQYQIYRTDWLDDWTAGRDVLRSPRAGIAMPPVPPAQIWQPQLWRWLQQELTTQERASSRPALQRRVVQALQAAPVGTRAWPELPRRLVLFGSTQLPQSTLELLAALATRMQVVLAVPNPCRYHWADIMDGRELLQAARRRLPLRGGRELSGLPLAELHAHGHPLLAAWGRQARDFVRQLDAFDDVQRSRAQFDVPRVDLFDDGPGQTLLEQVQARIRDLVPLPEHEETRPPSSDRSIVFHVAHSAQREIEILHDQLLHLLAHPPGAQALNPRDIVVMVPDIESFAPAIRAVFGQHPRGHARLIPWGIADVRDRGRQPLLIALEWLLRAPEQRFSLSQWRDLLELPSFARRFGLSQEDLPNAVRWLDEAGVRWGLDAQQRGALGLASAGEVNSWRFGLNRMLLGHAAGELDDGWHDIEPYGEVAGLAAATAGALAQMLKVLQDWWAQALRPHAPLDWAARLRQLLSDAFEAGDETERAVLANLDDALSHWLQASECAGFNEPVELAVAREAWLGALQEPGGGQRFKAGGVTFCTLLPMRAIPFEVVCLLGMNDGDYPRSAAPSDLDLMALPGQALPGDRSRRDDDRQLMLDALLSARRVLYVSWAGRSQRDGSTLPASVLVAQLRDYLDAAWGRGLCEALTTEHPLQPFSRRYFEAPADGSDHDRFTYAVQWRQAHVEGAGSQDSPGSDALAGSQSAQALLTRLSLEQLTAFVRHPVRAFFRHRLGVVFDDEAMAEPADDECFGPTALERALWVAELLEGSATRPLPQVIRSLVRAGRLPLGAAGAAVAETLQQTVEPMLRERDRVISAAPLQRQALSVSLPDDDAEPALWLEGDLEGLLTDAEAEFTVGPLFLGSALHTAKGALMTHKLLPLWLKSLASAAMGHEVLWVLIATDASAAVSPSDPVLARAQLQALLRTFAQSLREGRPLATAPRTALAWLDAAEDVENAESAGSAGNTEVAIKRATAAYDGSESSSDAGPTGEARDACLQRLWPDFDALWRTGRFETDSRSLYEAFLPWLNSHVQIEPLPEHLPDASESASPQDDRRG